MRKERNFRVSSEDPQSIVSAIEQIAAAVNEVAAESEAWRLVALSLISILGDRTAPFVERAAIPVCFSVMEALASSLPAQNAAAVREVRDMLVSAWSGCAPPSEAPTRPLLRLVQSCESPPAS